MNRKKNYLYHLISNEITSLGDLLEFKIRKAIAKHDFKIFIFIYIYYMNMYNNDL